MSDTCIVCLGDLSTGIDGVAEQSTGAVAKSPTADRENDIEAATAVLSTPTAADPTKSVVKNEPIHDHVIGADILAVTSGYPFTKKECDTAVKLEHIPGEMIAHLQPCGHDLHNECLKPWVERANSCPICRSSFHLVELLQYVGGPVTDSYPVADKTQVADVDPSMFLEVPDEYEDEGACQVCGEDDNEDILMYCDGCGKLWHTYCAEIDEVPIAAWFCDSCANPRSNAPVRRQPNNRTQATGMVGRRRTRGMERRRRNINATQDDGWNQVWQSVWSQLNIDLDFPYDEEGSSATAIRRHRQAIEEDRIQHQAFETRARIAEIQGAGGRFRAARPSIITADQDARASLQNRLVQESAEEIEAWNAYAEATEDTENETAAAPTTTTTTTTTNTTTSSARKRRSSLSPERAGPSSDSPDAREHKRRRTSNSNSVPISVSRPQPSRRQRATMISSPGSPNSTRQPRNVVDVSGPSFLQSLLQEVEGSTGPSGPALHRPRPRNPTSPPGEQVSPRPSSPATSHPSSPRALSATPPPLLNGFRPSSPPGLSSTIQPVYPKANYSPGQPSSPVSPVSPTSPGGQDETVEEQSHHHGPRVPAQAVHVASAAPRTSLRRPRIPDISSPSRTRSHDAPQYKPNVTAAHKADVQKLVSAALKPHYHEQKISKEEYTNINRDVSRMLYSKIDDFEALDLEGKAKWAEVAGEEVNKAVTALRA